jgi:peroxiredoxin
MSIEVTMQRQSARLTGALFFMVLCFWTVARPLRATGQPVTAGDRSGRRGVRGFLKKNDRSPWRWFLLSGLAFGWALLVLALFPSKVLQAAPHLGDVPPKATLTDLKGASVAIPGDFKGKVALIHFFATWCTYCPKEIAVLESLSHKYRGKGIITCSVDVGESREKVASFAENQRISYPLLLDPSSSVARQYAVTGIPTTYVLDREGKVRFRIIGEITADGLERIMRSLL